MARQAQVERALIGGAHVNILSLAHAAGFHPLYRSSLMWRTMWPVQARWA
jgi:hypothetical protein